MSLTLMEPRETQEEGLSHTEMFELAYAHAAAQRLDDATIAQACQCHHHAPGTSGSTAAD